MPQSTDKVVVLPDTEHLTVTQNYSTISNSVRLLSVNMKQLTLFAEFIELLNINSMLMVDSTKNFIVKDLSSTEHKHVTCYQSKQKPFTPF